MLKIAIAFLWALSLSVGAAEPKSAATYEPPAQQEAGKTNTNQQPSEVPNQNASAAASEREPQQQHFGQRFWDFTLTDALIAVFTFVLACFGIKQWSALTQAADAARRAAEVAEAALNIGQRAFVWCPGFISTALMSEGRVLRWRFQPKWENTGTTQTKNAVNHVSHLRNLKGTLPNSLTFEDLWDDYVKDKQRTPILIGAKGIVFGEAFEISVDVLRAMAAGAISCYTWGWIDYDDVLPNTVRHRTEFCFELVVLGDPAAMHADPFGFRLHWKHNGADDECMRKPAPYVPPK